MPSLPKQTAEVGLTWAGIFQLQRIRSGDFLSYYLPAWYTGFKLSAIMLLALSRKNPFGCNRNRQFELR